MRAVTQDVGQAEEELDIEFTGEEFEIGFNPAFLIDGIDGVDGEQVDAEVHQPAAPRPGDGRGRELPLPDHADPAQQLNDVRIGGPLPLGAFLKLAGAVPSGGEAKRQHPGRRRDA